MAAVTVLKRRLSTYGSKNKETGEFVYSTGQDDTLQTTLGSVQWFKVICVSTASDTKHFFNYNSDTVGTTGGTPGMIAMDGDEGTHALTDGETYAYEAIGS